MAFFVLEKFQKHPPLFLTGLDSSSNSDTLCTGASDSGETSTSCCCWLIAPLPPPPLEPPSSGTLSEGSAILVGRIGPENATATRGFKISLQIGNKQTYDRHKNTDLSFVSEKTLKSIKIAITYRKTVEKDETSNK